MGRYGDADGQILRQFKAVRWQLAYRTQDAELPDGLLHDSFEMVDNDGVRSTKSAELADWVSCVCVLRDVTARALLSDRAVVDFISSRSSVAFSARLVPGSSLKA